MRRRLVLLPLLAALLLAPLVLAQAAKPSATRHSSPQAAPVPQAEMPAPADTPQTESEIQETPKSDDSAPQFSQRAGDERMVAPEGTAIYFKLDRAISSRHNREGDAFVAHVTRDVLVEGRTVIPAGSSLHGSVTKATNPRRIHGTPRIALRAERVELPDGSTLAVKGIVIDTAQPRRYHVDDEGRIRGPLVHNLDKVETFSLAGSGIIAGAIIAGPHGAVIGALAGLAIGTTHSLVKRHEMVLPMEVEIILELSGPAYSTHDARAALN